MSDEQLDNSTAIGHIIETGDLEEARSILGDRDTIRYAGIIRAGVKVPKNNCTPAEKTKFKELEAQGLPYDEIDRQIGGEPKTSKSKLFPTNVDYFVIRDCDFRRPGDAAYIREHFKDPDGKVRRLPIWLAVGDLEKVIPHNFRAFDGSGSVRCVSFYDGDTLKFRYVEKGLKKPKQEDWKILDSDDEEVASKACGYKVTFGGLYRVNIPGLRGLGEIVVPTRSWFGMGDAHAQLRRVRQLLGRFDGLLNGEPFLEICKVQEFVKDPEGKKVKQWLITIELAVDPMELAKHAEKTLVRGARALSLFNQVAPVAAPVPAPEVKAAPPEEKPAIPGVNWAENKKAVDLIYAMGARADISSRAVNKYAETVLGATLETEPSISRLRKFFADFRVMLSKDTAGTKTFCEGLLDPSERNEQGTVDPEVEAMLQEIERLAENGGLGVDHVWTHMTVVSGGTDPTDMVLQELQQFYREIEARLKNDPEVFKAEIEQDFTMYNETTNEGND